MRLRCTDPPVASTGLLYSMGFNQYSVRRFWSELPLGVYNVPLYTYLDTFFNLELEHAKTPVREAECEGMLVPLDNIDSIKWREVSTPQSHVLYARISGRIEGNVIKVNVVRLAKVVETYEPGWVDMFLAGVMRVYRDKSLLAELEKRVLEELLKRRSILSFILPHIPSSREDLHSHVPLVRFLSTRR